MSEDGGIVFNHVGQCVADLARARRFYEELLGFRFERDLRPPDDPSAKLLRLDPPLGMSAVYLRRGPLVLELLHYDRPHNSPYRERVMDEPGLTHLSLGVADLDGVLDRVAAYGGQVLDDTRIAAGAFIRDPDGQLVELLRMRVGEGQ